MSRILRDKVTEAHRSEWSHVGHDIEVFVDGDCPLCAREVRFLRRLDRRGRIQFTDIAAPDFDASRVGVSWHRLMSRMHGRLPDGTLIEGVEVFRRLYAAVGFGRLITLTRLPGISSVLDMVYGVAAKNRLRLTGRCVDSACKAPDSNDRVGSASRTSTAHQRSLEAPRWAVDP